MNNRSLYISRVCTIKITLWNEQVFIFMMKNKTGEEFNGTNYQ